MWKVTVDGRALEVEEHCTLLALAEQVQEEYAHVILV